MGVQMFWLQIWTLTVCAFDLGLERNHGCPDVLSNRPGSHVFRYWIDRHFVPPVAYDMEAIFLQAKNIIVERKIS